MDSDMDHQEILKLDAMIHAPIRLAILSVLISVENANFTFLKEKKILGENFILGPQIGCEEIWTIE